MRKGEWSEVFPSNVGWTFPNGRVDGPKFSLRDSKFERSKHEN